MPTVCMHGRKCANVLFPDMFLWAHLDIGAAVRSGRSGGKGGGRHGHGEGCGRRW